MSSVPNDLHYSSDHEWVQIVDSTTIRFGITDHAQDALGDIVFVSLPAHGAALSAGSTCGEIESTKSVSDIYAPVSGTVSARNDGVDEVGVVADSDGFAWHTRTAAGALLDGVDAVIHLAGAGLDTFELFDPLEDGGPPGVHPLMGLDNVVLSPHVAAGSNRSGIDSVDAAIANIAAIAAGRWPPAEHVVNPDVVPWFPLGAIRQAKEIGYGMSVTVSS